MNSYRKIITFYKVPIFGWVLYGLLDILSCAFFAGEMVDFAQCCLLHL